MAYATKCDSCGAYEDIASGYSNFEVVMPDFKLLFHVRATQADAPMRENYASEEAYLEACMNSQDVLTKRLDFCMVCMYNKLVELLVAVRARTVEIQRDD